MKKFFLSLLAIGIALSAGAQSKLDLQSRATLRQLQKVNTPVTYNAKTKSLQTRTAPATIVNAIVKLNDGVTAADLEAEGVKVNRMRGNIALVTLPVKDVERVSSLKGIKKMQLERKVYTKMDKARAAVGVDKIHAGEDLPKAYTGKGVVAGIVDQGFDPNHINFKDENDSCRIKQLTYMYYPSTATQVTDVEGYLFTAEDMHEFTTDDNSTFHATHTTGIMAGGYKGNVSYGTGNTSLSAKVVEGANPYYGIAYDSEIVAATGDLSDYVIALGVEQIIDYAAKANKPTAINLSLGSNIGAHDGKQVMCQYLSLAAQDSIVHPIICLAAGNEGDMPIALTQTFTADDTELKTCIYPAYGNQISGYYNLRYGQVYIYSNDSTEFEVDMVVVNKSRNTIVYQRTISGNTEGAATYVASDAYAEEGDLTPFNFKNYFDGYMGFGSMIDEDNGRYYALIDYFTSDNQTRNANGNYVIGFIVRGKEGQRIDCFCDAVYTYFDNYALEGWDEGTCNGSISDMACGDDVIVVGSYNTRQKWVSLDAKAYQYSGYTEGEVSNFSSYGTLIDGRNLPTVCAPGCVVISSTSTPYLENYSSYYDDSYLQGRYTEEDGRVNCWEQALGSSMATPVVTGSIALWLEADPTLTVKEVKEIIEATAVKDSNVTGFTGDPVQWGAGKFDAYAGLKEVIRRASDSSAIKDIRVNDDRLMVTGAGKNVYNVFLGGAKALNVTLYNMQGQAVKNCSVNGDEVTVDASTLATGVYVMNVNGVHSQKILVK